MKFKIIAIGIFSMIVSCKTYAITPSSFKTQLTNAKTVNTKEVTINNPLTSGTIVYLSNDVESILVVDKNGQESLLENSPSIEMRVTHVNGKKYHFYFDTILLEDITIRGARSRFANKLTRKISMDSIVKIEIQNGGKKYNYQ